MGKIWDFVVHGIFQFPVKEQRFITQTPKDVIKALEKDYYTKKILQRNTQLEVENLKKDRTIAEYKKKEQEDLEEKEFFKELQNRKKKEKIEESELSMLFTINTKSPKLSLKSNRIFGDFVGFYVRDTDDGTTIYYPAIRKGSKLMKINCPDTNPLKFFKSELNLVSQIKSGRIDTDIEPNSEGKMVLMKDKDETERVLEKIHGKKVKIINLADAERMDYEKKIGTLREQAKQYANMAKDLQDKEIAYESHINNIDLENMQLEKDRDIIAAERTALIEKQTAMVKATAKALASVQDLQINQVLTEKQAVALQEANDELIELITKYIPKEKRALAEEEVLRLIQKGIDIRKSSETPPQIIVSPPPTEKEVKKAIEEGKKETEK